MSDDEKKDVLPTTPSSWDEKDILTDPAQHQQKCPACLSTRVAHVKGQNFMGCDNCGHVWVGKDFGQDEQETAVIPDTDS